MKLKRIGNPEWHIPMVIAASVAWVLLEIPWFLGSLGWWLLCVVPVYMLLRAHSTLVAVTLYLHRCVTHQAITMHPLVALFFRIILWLWTGMVTKEWELVHRWHHAHEETERDSHSPVQLLEELTQRYGREDGVQHWSREWYRKWGGVHKYRIAARDPEIMSKPSFAPTDWAERNVFSRFPALGLLVTLLLDVLLLGPLGFVTFIVQMNVVPLLAAGAINGSGHASGYVSYGYRNFNTRDHSLNLCQKAVAIAGEELHNNHHQFPSSAIFAHVKGEFDIGGFYLTKILVPLGLASITERGMPPTQEEVREALAS